MKMDVQSVKNVVKVEAVKKIKIFTYGTKVLEMFHEEMQKHAVDSYLELMDAKREGIYQRIKNKPNFEYGSITKKQLDDWIKELFDCKPTAKSRLRMFSLRRKHFWKRVKERRKNGNRRCNQG